MRGAFGPPSHCSAFHSSVVKVLDETVLTCSYYHHSETEKEARSSFPEKVHTNPGFLNCWEKPFWGLLTRRCSLSSVTTFVLCHSLYALSIGFCGKF